jgi:hypothetical protein
MDSKHEDTLECTLEINEDVGEKYNLVKNIKYDDTPENEEKNLLLLLSQQSLKSKQCNEPYEILLSNILGLTNNPKKHGMDAWNNETEEESTEFYEYKPSSNTKNPAGTINDDSIKKIEKHEKYPKGSAWVILAGIDRTAFRFDTIYKFPLYIYNEDRMEYFNKTMTKNKNQIHKQTRITYGISIKKSIKLCKKLGLNYWVWRR